MLVALFWSALLLVWYIYVGFPLLLFIRAKLFRRPIHSESIEPEITVVIVAHNEAAGIAAKLDNLFASDYPQDRIKVVVASDGSDDDTNDIVRKDGRAVLLELPRQGKIPALNAAVEKVTSDIVVFSDANSMYTPSAIRLLVRPFSDPAVGGVAGSQRYVADSGHTSASTGERTYWSFDELLKRWQSDAGSITSATGAIYAIRRKLFEPVPGGVGDDAAISYRVVAKGFRMLFEPAAVAYERVAPSGDAEFQRKVRVCARGLRGLAIEPRLFNPLRYGFYSLQLTSHKLLRWLAAWPLIICYITSLLLVRAHPFYGAVALVQVLFYCGAGIMLLLPSPWARLPVARLFTLPFYFCLANLAFLSAQVRVARGQKIDRWEVRRSTTTP